MSRAPRGSGTAVDSDSSGLPIFTVPESHQQQGTRQRHSSTTGSAAVIHGSGLPAGPTPPGQSALVKAKFNIFKAAGSSRQLGGSGSTKKERVSISPTLAPSSSRGDDASHHGDGELDSTTLYDGDQFLNDGGVSAMTQGSSVTGDPLEDTVSTRIKTKAPLEVLQELNAHVLLALNRIEEQHKLHSSLKHCQAVSMIQTAAEGEDLSNINNTILSESSRRESTNSADNSTSESPPTSFHSDFGARCESVIMSDKRTIRGLTSTSFYSDPPLSEYQSPVMDVSGGGSSIPARTYSIWRGGTFNSFMVSSRGLDALAKMKGDRGSGGAGSGVKKGGGSGISSSGDILSDLQKHCLPPEPRTGHCPEWRHRIAALEMNELLRVSAPPSASPQLTVQALRDLLPSSASSQSLNRNKSMANLGIGMSFRFQRETSVNTGGSASPEFRPTPGRKGSMSPLHLGSEPPSSQHPQIFSLGPSAALRGGTFDGGRQSSAASGNSSLDFRRGSLRGGASSPGTSSFLNNSFFCDSGEPDRECTLSDVIQGIRYLRASTQKRRQRSDQYRDTISKLQKKKDALMADFENTRTAEWLPLCPLQPPGIGVASQITQLHHDIVWEPTRRVSRQRQNQSSQVPPTSTTLDESIQQHFSSITAAAAAATGGATTTSSKGNVVSAGGVGGLSSLVGGGGGMGALPVTNMLPLAPTSSKHLAKMLDEVLQEVRRLVHPLDHKECLKATKKLLSAGSKRITELDIL